MKTYKSRSSRAAIELVEMAAVEGCLDDASRLRSTLARHERLEAIT